jgi:hypothetical protein
MRQRRVRLANTRAELAAAFDGLPDPSGRRSKGDLRASDRERRDAITRLDMHEAEGHLGPAEAESRRERVRASSTPNEIRLVFVDLPDLAKARKLGERRISDHERHQASERLDEAFLNNRITSKEHERASELVGSSASRAELNAALHGLELPARAGMQNAQAIVRHAQSGTSRALAEGASRARAAVLRLALSVVAVLAAIVVVFAVGIVAGAVCLGFAVLLFGSAIGALFRSRRT